MDNIGDLKRELSMGLRETLEMELAPEENLVISLPGSFGEAIAVSDRRAFVLRDCESGLNATCNVFGYPLANVKSAQVISSQTGGYIELALSEAPGDPDQARVYFPSYDVSLFQSAAKAITQMVAAKPEAAAPVAAAPTAGGSSCPKCGAGIEERAPFCGQCGEQVRVICPECSDASLVGSKYCRGCGRELVPFTASCPKCGARISRWMSYCSECGSNLQQKCLACGMNIVSSWKHCANCGRLLGSDRLDPSAVRAAQRRLQAIREMEEETQTAPPQPQPSAPSATSAEDYNKRGRELFENGDLDGAIGAFKTAVEIEPGNASYHCNLAVAYDENEQDEMAFDEYSKTLDIDPKDLTALLSLGYMYSENEEPDKAQAAWDKVVEFAPESAEAEEARDNLRNLRHL
ncbi:MAG: zinc ribbon domain-containing protein [Armatimonadetes bacterium]|nr:zinc ribbon domain-containing protein [Armatimonadota bacterium]